DYATLGIPVIAARLRTVEYCLGDGAVELCEPGNVGDLARAIRLLYNNPDLRERLVERARQSLDALNWPNQGNEYYRAFDFFLVWCLRFGRFLQQPSG